MRAHFQPPRAYFSIIKGARGDHQNLLRSLFLLHHCVGSCGSYRGILDPSISESFVLLHDLVGSCGSYRGILDPAYKKTFALLHENYGSDGSCRGIPTDSLELKGVWSHFAFQDPQTVRGALHNYFPFLRMRAALMHCISIWQGSLAVRGSSSVWTGRR